ncbi:holin [Rhodococcus sp. NPDC057297]|uniref:holin n=1 Tax=Rhodococcus sp. NPDC057297 TaxID=3346090 RepID=UPI0036285620
MFTLSFWKSTAERVVATFVQALLPLLLGANLFDVDWKVALGAAGSAAALSLLKCLAAAYVGPTDSAAGATPSLVPSLIETLTKTYNGYFTRGSHRKAD